MCSCDGALDGAFDGRLERSILEVPLESAGGNALDLDEGIILGFKDGEVMGSELGYSHGVTLRLYDGSELGCLDRPFDGSNDGKHVGLLLCDSLR